MRLVVGFPAGGVTDVLARVLAERMGKGLGHPVVVENRPGAAGNIAAEQVARAAPDGYSLLLGTNASHATNPFLYRNVSFDPIRDFTAIGMVATITNVLVVHPSVPARNVAELVALAKANPGKLNFASAAPGSAGHLIGELFKLRTGTDMVHVPYKGAAPAMTDMLAGRVELMFATLQTVLAPVQAGFEVPQWALAAHRLVDRVVLEAGAAHGHEERGVRAPRHPAVDLDLAVREERERVGDQFIRGHGWPSGSIGKPHHWHVGRPAATTSSAWSQNAAAWPRLR